MSRDERHVERLTCKSCGKAVEGTFCAHCGQRAGTKRLTAVGLFTDTLDHVFDLEAPLIRTTVNCLYRPGWVAKQYAQGQRKVFSNPFKFVLLAVALNVLVINILGFDIFEAVAVPANNSATDNSFMPIVNEAMHASIRLSKQYALFFSLVLLPIYAILIRLLFFKDRWNFIEYIVLGVYVSGAATLVQTLSIPFAAMINIHIFKWVSFLLFAYYLIGPIQFCGGNQFVATLKSFVVVFIYFILQGIFVFGMGLIVVSVSKEDVAR